MTTPGKRRAPRKEPPLGSIVPNPRTTTPSQRLNRNQEALGIENLKQGTKIWFERRRWMKTQDFLGSPGGAWVEVPGFAITFESGGGLFRLGGQVVGPHGPFPDEPGQSRRKGTSRKLPLPSRRR